MRELHGPDLDAAMEASVGGPEAMHADFGVCLTALDTRTRQLVDDQLREFVDGDAVGLARDALLAAGFPQPDLSEAEALARRAGWTP